MTKGFRKAIMTHSRLKTVLIKLEQMKSGQPIRGKETYDTHPSILIRKSSFNSTINFSFRNITAGEMLVQLQNLNPKRGSQKEVIPP